MVLRKQSYYSLTQTAWPPKSRQTTCTKICWRIRISSTPAITQESTHSTVQPIKRSLGSLKTRPVAGEWVGLRAKMYSMVTEGGKEKKTGKGIKKSVRHQDFKDCLLESREYQHFMMGFQSQRHQLFTVKRTKKSSCPFDDERLILEDGCMTRAHGHWRNAIARPSQAPTEAEPSEEGRLESMTALSLSKSNTDVQEPSTVDSSDAQESSTVYSTDLNGYSFPWGVYSVTARFSK